MGWGWSKSHYNHRKKSPHESWLLYFPPAQLHWFSDRRGEAVSVPAFPSGNLRFFPDSESRQEHEQSLLCCCMCTQSSEGRGCWARSFGSSVGAGEHWGHSSRYLWQPGLVRFSAEPLHYSTSTVVLKIVLGMKIGHRNNCNNNSISRAGNVAKLQRC